MRKKYHAAAFALTAALAAAALMGCSNPSSSGNTQAAATETAAEADSEQDSGEETTSDEPEAEETEADTSDDSDVLMIADQGIFSAGGTTITSEGTFDPEDQWEEIGAGQTAHVDHANVLYQIPAEETGLPMVFLHGYGQLFSDLREYLSFCRVIFFFFMFDIGKF